MPLVFECRLFCDSPTCGNEQTAFAQVSPEGVFAFSYDKTSGFLWKRFGDKTGCSLACHAQIEPKSAL